METDKIKYRPSTWSVVEDHTNRKTYASEFKGNTPTGWRAGTWEWRTHGRQGAYQKAWCRCMEKTNGSIK